MGSRSMVITIAVLAVGSIGCSSGRYSASAFHLPPDGDIEKGKAEFAALGCNSCHKVSGVDLPRATVQPPVPVVLGGAVDSRLSDAYLVTSAAGSFFMRSTNEPVQILGGYPGHSMKYSANRSSTAQYSGTCSVF